MKTILCFGDSNTWGYIPLTEQRYPFEKRWTGILQKRLAGAARIVEEGLKGRTTVWDEPFRPGRNGQQFLGPLLESHAPIDLLVIMLGTNDMKHHYNVSPHESARGLAVLVEIAQGNAVAPTGNAPDVLIVAPPRLQRLSELMHYHFERGVEKSVELAMHYRKVADQYGCHFVDAGEHTHASDEDGVHLDEAGHQKLAQVLAERIGAIVGR
jgi:lysophospholipase L1-like esterase